jgi:hypothetical protein
VAEAGTRAPVCVGRESPGSGGSSARRPAYGDGSSDRKGLARVTRPGPALRSGVVFFSSWEVCPVPGVLPASHSAPLALRFCNGGEV